jgi:anti-sigma factor RsiW
VATTPLEDETAYCRGPGIVENGKHMSVENLRCVEVTEILDDYLEGTMPDAERRRLEAHLSDCEGCTNYLEQLRATIRVSGALDDEALPPGMGDALLDAFRAWRGR